MDKMIDDLLYLYNGRKFHAFSHVQKCNP